MKALSFVTAMFPSFALNRFLQIVLRNQMNASFLLSLTGDANIGSPS